jgi:hypothetical protein
MSKRHTLATALMTATLALGAFTLNAAGTAMPLQAHEFKKGALTIDHPFARATIAQRPGAAFAVIMNAGSEDDRLIGASTPAADRAEMHTHLMENGVARMRQVDAIDVPAGGSAELKPGGYHIMMFNLDKPLKEGETFPLTLTFEKAGAVEVTVKVEGMGAGAGMKHGKDMKHGEGMKHGTDAGTKSD